MEFLVSIRFCKIRYIKFTTKYYFKWNIISSEILFKAKYYSERNIIQSEISFQAKGVNSNDKNHIIRLHNDIRQKALQGQIPGQPRAKRMQKLLWDESLAYQAQIIADSCEFAHKEVKDGEL